MGTKDDAVTPNRTTLLDEWKEAVDNSRNGTWIDAVLANLPELPAPKLEASKPVWNSLSHDLTALSWHARSRKRAATVWVVDANALENRLVQLQRQDQRLALSILYLQGCRFDFHAARIKAALPIVERHMGTGASCFDVDIFRGFDYFARLGSSTVLPDPRELEEAFVGTDCGKMKHLILHGLWLLPDAQSKPEYLEVSKLLADRILEENPNDQVAIYRRARAKELLGDYRGALEDMDRVVAMVKPDSPNSFEDYHLRRQIIEAELSVQERIVKELEERTSVMLSESLGELNGQVKKLELEIKASADAAAEEVRGQVSDALFRVVEILGLFVGLIGVFAATGISLASDNLSFLQRITILIGGLLVPLVYFVILRKIVSPGR